MSGISDFLPLFYDTEDARSGCSTMCRVGEIAEIISLLEDPEIIRLLEDAEEMHRNAVEEAREWLYGNRDDRSKVAINTDKLEEIGDKLRDRVDDLDVEDNLKQDLLDAYEYTKDQIHNIAVGIFGLKHAFMNYSDSGVDAARTKIRKAIHEV